MFEGFGVLAADVMGVNPRLLLGVAVAVAPLDLP
jgi:hypothetical protein